MAAKNVPLHIPKALSAQIDRVAKALELPQSQCMRLSIQYGLPELMRRLSPVKDKRKKLPSQSEKPWVLKSFLQIDLDAPIDIEDLNEDII
jgi:hypothetical protein